MCACASQCPFLSCSYASTRESHQLLLAPCLALLLVRLFKCVQLMEETTLLHLLDPAVHILALAHARVLGKISVTVSELVDVLDERTVESTFEKLCRVLPKEV